MKTVAIGYKRINKGFYEKNFMGMNASDYGGGIPVIDLWRKDAGIAIGNTASCCKTYFIADRL